MLFPLSALRITRLAPCCVSLLLPFLIPFPLASPLLLSPRPPTPPTRLSAWECVAGFQLKAGPLRPYTVLISVFSVPIRLFVSFLSLSRFRFSPVFVQVFLDLSFVVLFLFLGVVIKRTYKECVPKASGTHSGPFQEKWKTPGLGNPLVAFSQFFLERGYIV